MKAREMIMRKLPRLLGIGIIGVLAGALVAGCDDDDDVRYHRQVYVRDYHYPPPVVVRRAPSRVFVVDRDRDRGDRFEHRRGDDDRRRFEGRRDDDDRRGDRDDHRGRDGDPRGDSGRRR